MSDALGRRVALSAVWRAWRHVQRNRERERLWIAVYRIKVWLAADDIKPQYEWMPT
jgi:hypothetical protein